MRRRCCGSCVPKICTGHAMVSQNCCLAEFGGFSRFSTLGRPSESTPIVMELTSTVEFARSGRAGQANRGVQHFVVPACAASERTSRRDDLATTRSCSVELSPRNRSMRRWPRLGPYDRLLPTVHVLGFTGIVVRVSPSQPFGRLVDCKLRRTAYYGASNDQPGTRRCAVVDGDTGGGRSRRG